MNDNGTRFHIGHLKTMVSKYQRDDKPNLEELDELRDAFQIYILENLDMNLHQFSEESGIPVNTLLTWMRNPPKSFTLESKAKLYDYLEAKGLDPNLCPLRTILNEQIALGNL